MSLQFYPHEDEDVRAKRLAPPEAWRDDRGIVMPMVIIDLVLAFTFVSCAGADNIPGALIALGLAAGVNTLAFTGNH